MPVISALTDPTVLDFVTGEVLTAAKLESDSGNLRTAIVDLNDVVADLEDNYASPSEPTDKPEGKLFCDTTNDPAELKVYIDGLGTLQTILTSVIPTNVWPSFFAHRNGVNQDNITTDDKIEFNDDSTSPGFDTNSDYDKDTNFRFTPTVAGKYLLIAQIEWIAGSITDGDGLSVKIFKNGAEVVGQTIRANTNSIQTQNVSAVVDANGTGDFFEVFALNGNRDTSDVDGDSDRVFFCGSRIA